MYNEVMLMNIQKTYNIPIVGKYDVIVAGGGVAGIPFVISAGWMLVGLQIFNHTVQHLAVPLLSCRVIEGGQRKNQAAHFLGFTLLSVGIGIQRHQRFQTAAADLQVFFIFPVFVRQQERSQIVPIVMGGCSAMLHSGKLFHMLFSHSKHIATGNPTAILTRCFHKEVQHTANLGKFCIVTKENTIV